MPHLLIRVSAIALLAFVISPAAAEEIKLPAKAQEVMSKLEKSESKLTSDYKKALNVERARVITDLQKVQKDVTKSGDLDGALAIKNQIEDLHAKITEDEETDLLGNPKSKPDPTKLLVGKWDFVKNNGFSGVIEFKDDGNCTAIILVPKLPKGVPNIPGRWQFKDGKIHVVWFGDANRTDLLEFTATTKLIGTTFDMGKNSITATKKSAEK